MKVNYTYAVRFAVNKYVRIYDKIQIQYCNSRMILAHNTELMFTNRIISNIMYYIKKYTR